MFLTTPDFKSLPGWAHLVGSYTTVHQEGKWGWERPEGLVRLVESGWPETITTVIADLFRQAGIIKTYFCVSNREEGLYFMGGIKT